MERQRGFFFSFFPFLPPFLPSFLPFKTYPPQLSIPVAVSSSAILYAFNFSLHPRPAATSACSPAEMWCCTLQEPTLTRVLWMLDPARRAPGIRQRASELREQSRPRSPSGAARIGPTPANPANCRETSFGTVLGFQQMRSAYSNSSFPLYPAASCHFSCPVTPALILCYIAVLAQSYIQTSAIIHPYECG